MFSISLLSLLLSAIVNASPIARQIGHRGGIILSLSLTLMALVAGVIVWYEVIFGECEAYFDYLGTWFSVGTMNIVWEAYYDVFSAHMLLTVTVVSFAVHCFAVVYMKSDPHLNLFLGYLSAFTFFMVVLISGGNMLLMFVGFEGIGICSYLLIGYWSHRLAASKSALKAIVVNRISDGLLLWSIIWLWWYTGSLEYDLILLNDSNNITNILGIAILLGCAANYTELAYMLSGGIHVLMGFLRASPGEQVGINLWLIPKGLVPQGGKYYTQGRVILTSPPYSTSRSSNRISGDKVINDNQIISILVGTLLGDASIAGYSPSSRHRNSSVSFSQGLVHKDYLLHLWSIFSRKGMCS